MIFLPSIPRAYQPLDAALQISQQLHIPITTMTTEIKLSVSINYLLALLQHHQRLDSRGSCLICYIYMGQRVIKIQVDEV